MVREAKPHHMYVVSKDRGRETVERARVQLRPRLEAREEERKEDVSKTQPGPRRSERDRKPPIRMDL
jgi:hypothetical protein